MNDIFTLTPFLRGSHVVQAGFKLDMYPKSYLKLLILLP